MCLCPEAEVARTSNSSGNACAIWIVRCGKHSEVEGIKVEMSAARSAA
jgi:hypothetical protein